MNRRLLLQITLFVITLITTTLSGAEWMFGRMWFTVGTYQGMGWPEFWAGLNFSLPFLATLTVHEFGHYFVARANNVRVTLPYYIPLWLGGLGQAIGTMGAFIRIEDFVNSRRKYFDIGIAGPLAGFALAVLILWYGFTHLPPADYIFMIHPEYKKWGLRYAEFAALNLPKGAALVIGDNLLFWFFKTYVADPALLPPAFEIMHYPYLLSGYLALFFTALNLIPVGQLDGGHVLYALIGSKRFRIVAPVLFIAFVFYAGLGVFTIEEFQGMGGPAEFLGKSMAFWSLFGNFALYVVFLSLCFSRITENNLTNWLVTLSVVVGQFGLTYFFPTAQGYSGFLVFSFLLGRFLGIYHPETELQEPLDTRRKVLGWLALAVFVLCFSPQPFMVQ